jgi:hypothetical protein
MLLFASIAMTTLPYPQDDYSGSTLTTGAIAIGKPVRGVLNASFFGLGDSDWFRVNLTAGETYVFTMANISLNTPAAVDLLLRDANGKELTLRSGLGTQAPAFEFTATSSGTYYLDARTLNVYGGSAKNEYEVSVSLKQPGDDYLATSATTGVLVLGEQKSTVMENAGDVDWFRFTAQAGKTYAMAPALTNGGLMSFTVTDASGKVLAANGEAFTATAAGSYYVNASAYQAGTYGFTLSEANDDVGTSAATAGMLAKGESVTSTMNHIGDLDWYRVSLNANTYYTFELDRGTADSDALKFAFVKADGASLLPHTLTTDATGKAVMMVKVDAADDYYLSVAYGQYGSGAVAKPYTLAFSSLVTVDDHGGTTATATPVAVGATVTGELTGVEDVDVIKLPLKAGITYTFKVDGPAPGSMRVELKDTHDFTSRYESNGSFSVTPSQDGDYGVHLFPVGYYPTAQAQRLSYTFSASLTPDDFAANAAGAGKLAVGASVTGNLSEGGGDRDWIGVDMSAGTTYWLTLSSVDAQSYSLGGGRLFDANGNMVREVTGATSFDVPTLSFKPTASGTYYYEVFSSVGQPGKYKLSAALGTPDDFADTFLAATTLADGIAQRGTLEVPTDVDVFRTKQTAGKLFVLALESDWTTMPGAYDLRAMNVYGEVTYAASVALGSRIKYFLFSDTSDVSHVSISSFLYSGAAVGGYTIKAYSVADDYASTILTTGKVAVNGSVSGVIDAPGDKDYFKVTLEAGKTYVFDLHGAASGAGTFDAGAANVLSVIDPYGMASNPSQTVANSEARIQFVPNMTGDHFISVGAAYGSISTGSYKVTAHELSGDVKAPTLVTAPATAVSTVGKLVFGFSEQVKLDGSAFTIKDSAGKHVLGNTLLNVSALHDVVTIDPANFLLPGRSYTLDIGAGGVRDLAGNQYAGQTSFTFTTPAASASASANGDMLTISASGNYVDAGAGVDTVVLPGNRSAYQLIPLGDGRTQVQPINGAASNVLVNVERIFFDDKAFAMDAAGSAGQAFRLYQAAFNRAPDAVGVGFWTGHIDRGTSMKVVAEAFVTSAEFIDLYGTAPSNAEFVDLLYQNVLHRAGDAGGIAHWNKVLDGGYSRAETLIAFAESVENVSATAVLIANGFEYVPY